MWLMTGLAAASLFNFLYSLLLVKRKLGIRIAISFEREGIANLLQLALPFGLYAVFQRAYTYLDTLILSSLAGMYAVGLYQVAFKIIFAIQFLPMAFTASLYPAMSLYWKNNREQLGVTFTRALNYLIIISLPISLGTIFIADKIVAVFSEGYSESVLPLKISIAAVPFIFINFPIGSLLNACDRQARNTVNIATVLAASVVLNFILIPKHQAVGASITVLITNILMFLLGLRISFKIIDYDIRPVLHTSGKAVAAGLMMGLIVMFLRDYLNIILVVMIGGFSYFAGLYIFGGFSKADVISIYRSFSKKNV
jgi:O-antigen/teichoic acid export membrane protein